MEETAFQDVTQLAGMLRDGEISATELVEATLRRIETAEALGAFVDVGADAALAAAAAVDAADPRPLAGVPVAIKANTAVAGLISDHGSRLVPREPGEQDAYLVRRLREAGMIPVGTTRLPELGILPTTEPAAGGACRNPWDPSRTPGGSSGGSAAAVAAGLVPLAHGNDGGGSIRIPAACCGLLGLKPSRGRVSRGPFAGDDFLVADGVLSRTVADTAIALDVLAGYEVGDATWAPRPQEPYTAAIRRDPGRLRMAFTTRNMLGVPVDPACKRAAREAAELLARLGHEVEEVEPMLAGPEALGLFTAVFASDKARFVHDVATRRGRPLEDGELEPLTRGFVDLANGLTGGQYLSSMRALQAQAREIVAFFADFDCLVTPALAQRPLPIGELHGGLSPEEFARSGRFSPYTALFNVSGQPAVSIPMGLAGDGLPVAVQIAAHPLADDTLLQVARQIEIARPWADLRPPAPR